MAGERRSSAPGWPEDLAARVAANEAKIAALQQRAERSEERAGAGESRAADDQLRISALEARADVDAVLIAELQSEGMLSRDKTENLTLALKTSRTIGAAVGIVMASHHVSEEVAFEMLRAASMHTNQKLRELAERVVLTGEFSPVG